MRQRPAALALLSLIVIASACSRPRGLFLEQNARSHVEMLAGTIGSRPVGTPANARARAYIIDQLKLYGFEVRVQETDARRPEFGVTARVSNIIAMLPGERPEAVGVISHYDSARETPGAADDGFGVAVSLEAARSFASRERRKWSLFVLVTDAEESGLMGAAGLMTDREVTDRLRAYINLEAVGSSTPVVLFETGPGNRWLTSVWARHAPYPRGGSYALEVYRRLPNDTDFSILKRRDIPGLNFASAGDSYPYHTARDTVDRLSPRALRETGENVVSILGALQDVDVTQRSKEDGHYFDVAGITAVSYGPGAAWILAAAALALGVIAFVRITAAVIRAAGVLRWILTLLWALLALVLAPLAMVGITWALRASREFYHPWYAHPDRLFALLAVVGFAVAWAVTRLGAWLPPRAHVPRHPATAWSLALPLWIGVASLVLWTAPAAAHLWTVPLLAAGLGLSLVPAHSGAGVRLVSLAVLVVVAMLWLRDAWDLARFAVAVLGRMPFVTPAYIYAAFLTAAGIMLVPPFIGAFAPPGRLLQPSLMTAVCLVALAVAGGLAYAAPAYTHEQPLRRYVRAIQDGGALQATWEVASTEPGLDLDVGAPGGWSPTDAAPPASVPIPRFPQSFVFRTKGPSLGAAPAQFSAFTQTAVAGGIEVAATVIPSEPGVVVTFVAPPELTPSRSNLPGILRAGRWRATYVAPTPEGVVWRAGFSTTDASVFQQVRVLVNAGGFPGGDGWQRLAPWLPQDRTVWNSMSIWILPPPSPPIEPVPPLR
ncbi:MAG TPA: M28 family peptidase [Chloroflexota bacterium]|nr:M28 family peptidase [Chloroflexota bacterium]